MIDLLDQEKTRLSLEAGRDYPQVYREFVEWFPNNEACKAYLEKLRWPNGFICPACSSTSGVFQDSLPQVSPPNICT